MKLKTNLHFHIDDDKEDSIPYSFTEALDEASRLGFQCLAITCHNTYTYTPERAKEAASRGILLIPGIERTIEKKHVLVFNCDESITSVQSFEGLIAYKKTHPGIFIIAPHPFLGSSHSYSLHQKLLEYISLFDAIEQTWFYSFLYNPNRKATAVATTHSLPLIATSDVHELKWLSTSFAEIETKEKTITAVFEAIRNKRFKNVSRPRSFFFEMTPYAIRHIVIYYFSKLGEMITKFRSTY